MTVKLNELRRSAYAVAAAVTTFAIGAAAVLPGMASASTQVITRSIQMSDSRVSATGVTYKVTFKPQTSNAKSFVIDFCQNGAIIGAACTTTNGVTFTSPALANSTLPGGWTTITSSGSTVKIAGGGTALTSGTSYTFEITNVNNPTGTTTTPGAVGSFYARVYTYGDTTYGSTTTVYTNATTLGDYKDYGGFALSTANTISVSATVMETLTFCVSGLAPGPGCGTSGQAVTSPTVVLGSGSPQTIDSALVYDNSSASTSFMQLSTNATSGAIVNMKSGYASCNGLSADNGTTCGIPGSAGALAAGTAGFGLKVGAGTGGTGTIAGANGYTAGAFHMGTTTNTYGDTIANTAGTVSSNVNSQLIFGATANVTTPAGVYAANEQLIATGTF